MYRQLILIVLVGLLEPVFGSVGQASAQSPEILPFETSEPGQEYLRSLRLRGINPEVTYFEPSGPPPALDTNQKPATPAERSNSDRSATGSEVRWVFGLITGAILLLIAYMFVRFGGGLAVSLKRDAQNPGRERKAPLGEAPVWAEKLNSLDEILRMRDRRQALVYLARKALTSTVAVNGVLMQRSWTARDALRHIPQTQNGLEALRALVLSSERVQFGDRDVTEEEFRDHVEKCRPLIAAGTA